MTSQLTHLFTPQSAIIVGPDGRAHTALKGSSVYDKVATLLLEGRSQEALGLLDKPVAIKKASKGKFNVVNGAVVIDGETLPDALSRKLLALIESGEDTSRLERFWNNLSANPSEESKKALYGFLDANQFPLTRDGCFLAYKKVRDDWKDCHSGTIENKPGTVVQVAREQVDPDSSRTCSYGLHVAAFDYAKNFASGRMLEVKVNPADVVSVPPDHEQQKIRTCKYVVMRETESDKPHTDETFDNDADMPVIVEELKDAKVHTDNEGRLRVPGRFVRALGLGVGAEVAVVIDKNSLRLAIEEHMWDEEVARYTAQSDNSVRLSAKVLEEGGFGRRSLFTVHFDEETNSLCIS